MVLLMEILSYIPNGGYGRITVGSTNNRSCEYPCEMKKGLHPQMQWISYVTQSGRLMHITMTKIHRVGKVYHFRARRQMAQSLGQIAKFNRRYGEKTEANEEK